MCMCVYIHIQICINKSKPYKVDAIFLSFTDKNAEAGVICPRSQYAKGKAGLWTQKSGSRAFDLL